MGVVGGGERTGRGMGRGGRGGVGMTHRRVDSEPTGNDRYSHNTTLPHPQPAHLVHFN